jgi:D-glycero-alpha-D-manno-heptose-7-phosphate kinase
MIITRTPFRITLGGGGTDLPSYYSKYGGFIFSAAIDKYMFVTLNQPPVDDFIRVKYSVSETVERLEDVKHDMAREILRFMGFDRGIEVTSIGDLPAQSGLGSSSCYAVGLLNALHAMKRDNVSLSRLAEEDFHIENEVLHRPIGKQDPYLAAYGGLAVLDIEPDGSVKVRQANVSREVADELNRNMLVFFTGVTRSADDILSEQVKSVDQQQKVVLASMDYIKDLGYQILDAVESGNLDEVGKKFHTHWEHKKKISTRMSNPQFDKIYDVARQNGALGGKISGAGGGGFFTFYVPENHRQFRDAMRELGLREMRYRFDFDGTKVLVDF